MTMEEFKKVVDSFADDDIYACAAYVDGRPATAVQGSVEAAIVAALHTVLTAASCSDNKMKHLISASYILHGMMLAEMGDKPMEAQP